MNTRILSALVGWLLWCSGGVGAQQYFRLLETSDKPYEQKIARFANGDILLAGSPLVGETSAQNGGLNLTCLDICGNVRWAMNYQWKKNYMTFKDIKITDNQEIYIYGTAFESPNSEYIFLLKLNSKGGVLAFRVYHGGAVDNFTYNIQVKDNQVIAYGLLLDWNTPKRGFIAGFDEKLNFRWGKVFEPFESVGELIITEDNHYLGRSGFYHIKLNNQGNVLWSSTFRSENGSGLYPVAGPLEVNNGYLFQAIHNNTAFFYKIDQNGRLLWKSEAFPANNHPVNMTLLADGNVLATYSEPGMGENFTCQLLLSPEGKIIQQKKLITDQSLQIATLYHVVDKKRRVNMIGTTELQTGGSARPAGFILQYALDSLAGRCFRWEVFNNLIPNTSSLEFTPLELRFFEPRFRLVEASITSSKRNFTFTESCDIADNNIITFDTLLTCGQNWQVRLPNANFKWEDEVIANPRTLERPGIYRASDNNCISPTTYTFDFQREPCQCNIYLPTAFSPNYDGNNDKLELFSNCTINAIQFSIYNRWGNKVFSSDLPNVISWDGFSKQKPAEAGIYVAVVHYQLLNESNEIEEGSIVQNVQLVR
ncbi:MAG: gliding motility-associated C-terminal domain-containing protein [Saprospiraceae bacterium]